MHPHHFDHETLECYRLLAGVARWYLGARFPRGASKLKSHGVEAAQSAALNTAEGRAPRARYRGPSNRAPSPEPRAPSSAFRVRVPSTECPDSLTPFRLRLDTQGLRHRLRGST